MYAGDGYFNLDTPFKELVNRGPWQIVAEYFPQMIDNPMMKMAAGFSLKQIANFASAMFPTSVLKILAVELAKIPSPDDASGKKPNLSPNKQRIETLLKQMTLGREGFHVGLCQHVDHHAHRTAGHPDHQSVRWAEWGQGAAASAGGLTSACFPAGISLASTWNTELLEKVGQALGEEAKTKGASMLLGPTVNMHRSPLNGRNFECYSEDLSHLSAQVTVAYIKGLQSRGSRDGQALCGE